MRLVFFGSRTIDNIEELYNALYDACHDDSVDFDLAKVTHINTGGAKGADTLGYQFAQQRGYPCTLYKPNWKDLGKGAGYARNKVLADNSDFGIAIWDGESKGTKHMIDLMEGRCYVYIVKPTIVSENQSSCDYEAAPDPFQEALDEIPFAWVPMEQEENTKD